jgi:hypothetical protein
MITKTSVAQNVVTLISAGRIRRWFIIENQSDTPMFIGLGGDSGITNAAGAKPGIQFAAGAKLTSGDLGSVIGKEINRAFYALHNGAAAKAVVLHEG